MLTLRLTSLDLPWRSCVVKPEGQFMKRESDHIPFPLPPPNPNLNSRAMSGIRTSRRPLPLCQWALSEFREDLSWTGVWNQTHTAPVSIASGVPWPEIWKNLNCFWKCLFTHHRHSSRKSCGNIEEESSICYTFRCYVLCRILWALFDGSATLHPFYYKIWLYITRKRQHWFIHLENTFKCMIPTTAISLKTTNLVSVYYSTVIFL